MGCPNEHDRRNRGALRPRVAGTFKLRAPSGQKVKGDRTRVLKAGETVEITFESA